MEITKKQEVIQVPTTCDYYELKLTYEELMVLRMLIGGVGGTGPMRDIVNDMFNKIYAVSPYREAPTFYNPSFIRENSENSQRTYLRKN